MSLHQRHLPLLLLSLVMHGACAQSTIQGEPIQDLLAPSGLSKLQAKAALLPAAVNKTSAQHLDQLIEKDKNEFIVLFKNAFSTDTLNEGTASANQARRLADEKMAFQAMRTSVRAAYNHADFEYRHQFVNLPMALVRINNRAALVKLLNDPQVVGVAENVKLELHTAQSLPLIGQQHAYQAGGDGAGTTVAVLDIQADYRLPLFGSCTAPGFPASCRVKAALNLVNGSPHINDPGSHGTNVAGIVASVAPKANLAFLDVFSGGAEIVDMIKGIDWAIQHQGELNIVALNLSARYMDQHCSQDAGGVMRNAFARARAVNMIPVISAGNQSNPTSSYPACATTGNNGVVVGAVYDQTADTLANCADAVVNTITCFSNYSPDITLYAPGSLIKIDDGYAATQNQFYGTSQAAPHVAGAIAVLRGTNVARYDTLDETLARLTRTGVTLSDTAKSVDRKPLLDLFASVSTVLVARTTLSQQLHVGFLGRPADPANLAAFDEKLKLLGVADDLSDFEAAYRRDYDASLRTWIDRFALSPESLAFYPGGNSEFVDGFYRRVLGRSPLGDELAFWTGLLDRKEQTRGHALLAMMLVTAQASTIPQDRLIFDAKVGVAQKFSTSLDLPLEIDSYKGEPALQQARDACAGLERDHGGRFPGHDRCNHCCNYQSGNTLMSPACKYFFTFP